MCGSLSACNHAHNINFYIYIYEGVELQLFFFLFLFLFSISLSLTSFFLSFVIAIVGRLFFNKRARAYAKINILNKKDLAEKKIIKGRKNNQ